MHNVSEITPENIESYGILLLGTSTGCEGNWHDDWEKAVEILKNMNLTGKTIALFGCGKSQPDGSISCTGIDKLYNELKQTGATLIGELSPDKGSAGTLSEEKKERLPGLAIDEADDDETNEMLVDQWTRTLNYNFNSHL